MYSPRLGGIKRRKVPPLAITILSSCAPDGWLFFYFVHEPQPAIGVVRAIYRAAPAPCQTLYRIFDSKLVYNTLLIMTRLWNYRHSYDEYITPPLVYACFNIVRAMMCF